MPCFGGIAVAKAPFDIARRPAGEGWAVPNEASGVTTRVDRLQALGPTLMVLDATGGLARAVPSALATAGLPGGVVHPRQVREWARATGPRATTEAWEARARGYCAAVIRPTPRPRPDAQTHELRALRGRRQPLIGRRTAAQHRLAGPRARLAKASAAHRTGRNACIATLDDDETTRRASPRWRANDDRLPRAPGRGPVCARTFLLALPEWGTLTRPQSAALVGVAPLHGARGTMRGRRTIGGGRAPGRTVLSMGTLVATRCTPVLPSVSQRLLAAGTVTHVALTACMPKRCTMLNALLKQRTPWHPQEVQS